MRVTRRWAWITRPGHERSELALDGAAVRATSGRLRDHAANLVTGMREERNKDGGASGNGVNGRCGGATRGRATCDQPPIR